MIWEENGMEIRRVPDLFFGANLTYQPTDKWSFLVESYNRYNSKRQDEWAKPGRDSHFNFMSEVGVDYKVSPRLHLNTFYDISFNEFSRYSNIGLGITWLLNKEKREIKRGTFLSII